MNKETGEQGRGILEYVREILLGAVSGLLLSMVLLLLISILMSSGTG